MKLLLAGGGTAGHVYPALATVAALRNDPLFAPAELLYVGSRGGMEKEIIEKASLPYADISATGLRGKSPLHLVAGVLQLLVGLVQALGIFGRYRPDVVLATGGYVCVPVVIAAWLRRVPVLIYLPDVEPGLAVSFLARFASRIAVTSADSRRFFDSRKVVATGYPVREELRSIERATARGRLGLPPGESVLLVVGGSRGAQTLNEAVARDLPRFLELAHVVHVSGQADESSARSRAEGLDGSLADRYHFHSYLHTADMAAALVAADLVVARAGASTLGEFPAAGLPAILVPYPYAGAHQRLNAAMLERLGAAVTLENDAVKAGALLTTTERLLGDRARLRQMSEAARSLDRPNAARSIALELVRLARRIPGKNGNAGNQPRR